MLAINEILNRRYRIIRQIGYGGMGAVYEAEDSIRFGKTVALKEILIDLTKAPTSKQQELLKIAFKDEAKILTKLDHEAFPQVIDYFTETDRQYLVIELVLGDDLHKRLGDTENRLTQKEILNFAEQLLDALIYLQRQTRYKNRARLIQASRLRFLNGCSKQWNSRGEIVLPEWFPHMEKKDFKNPKIYMIVRDRLAEGGWYKAWKWRVDNCLPVLEYSE